MHKAERQALIQECRTSGMTAKAWCEAKGIPYRQYIAWATKQNREETQGQEQQWVKVSLPREEPATEEIKLRCGKWTVSLGSGFSPSMLAEVLRAVDALC